MGIGPVPRGPWLLLASSTHNKVSPSLLIGLGVFLPLCCCYSTPIFLPLPLIFAVVPCQCQCCSFINVDAAPRAIWLRCFTLHMSFGFFGRSIIAPAHIHGKWFWLGPLLQGAKRVELILQAVPFSHNFCVHKSSHKYLPSGHRASCLCENRLAFPCHLSFLPFSGRKSAKIQLKRAKPKITQKATFLNQKRVKL